MGYLLDTVNGASQYWLCLCSFLIWYAKICFLSIKKGLFFVFVSSGMALIAEE